MTTTWTDKTWSDLCDYVNAMWPRGDPDARKGVYLTLANEALRKLNEASDGVYGSWESGSGATYISLSARTATFPTYFRSTESVWWDRVQLRERTAEWLDRRTPRWRTSVGIPAGYVRTTRGLILSSEPSGSTDGKLVVWGWGAIPPFTLTDGAANPLAYLPWELQMVPAYFVVAMLPLPKRGVTKDELVILAQTKQEHMALWQGALEEASTALRERTDRPYSGT